MALRYNVRAHILVISQRAPLIHWIGLGDNHQSFYPWDFLEFYLNFNKRAPESVEYVSPSLISEMNQLTRHRIEYFGAKGPEGVRNWPPSLKYDEFFINETDAVGRWTNFIVRQFNPTRIEDHILTAKQETLWLCDRYSSANWLRWAN